LAAPARFSVDPLFGFVEQEQDFVAVWKRMNLAAGVGAGGGCRH
jgi:hypothetical protein